MIPIYVIHNVINFLAILRFLCFQTDKSLKKSEDSENPHLRYNWLHVKQINNVLLYSTGNYIQNPVINCNWKEYEREYIYTHTYIHIKWNHFSVHQQLTQHCKSTIIEKKRKKTVTHRTSAASQINLIQSPSFKVHHLLGIRIERHSWKTSGSSRSSGKINIQTTSSQRDDF